MCFCIIDDETAIVLVIVLSQNALGITWTNDMIVSFPYAGTVFYVVFDFMYC